MALVLLDDDRLDTQACLKADVVEGLQICRVRYADVEPLTALHERQHAVACQQLL
jgi:hypothetical protein